MSQRFTVTSKNGRKASVRLEINPKAKRLILKVDPKRREGVAVASNPRQAKAAVEFAYEKAEWIVSQVSQLPKTVPFEPGAFIPFRGELVQLSNEGSGRQTRLDQSNLLISPGATETFRDRIVRYLRREAKADLAEAVAVHEQRLGVQSRAISVKDTRSRWGSCSSDRNLSFSWRLVCAPPFVLNYVAAHEVAHLVEMNHSPDFWALVDACVSDAKPARYWLKQNGAGLHMLGVAEPVTG